MVELTEITEDSQNLGQKPINPQPFGSEKAEESSDEEDYSSDGEDYYGENETLYDRIVALKDIIPPQQMSALKSAYNMTSSIFHGIFSKGGNLLWMVTTSALLLGVPLSLSILAEQQLIEMEKSFDLQKDANDILASGDTAAAPAAL
ncbi:HCL419Cp [Eremothecium sinecaudum]|uniref:HCL419Cp n=1 Tax=Eremothecium sinecaudum TaxID=45286 RepID=A0A109UYZ7_9SACH|nr:HCL419Cp [Eremothecium sinecaudum]AMD19732.1 HCL419Cp [Eremothecium sinecaudum]